MKIHWGIGTSFFAFRLQIVRLSCRWSSWSPLLKQHDFSEKEEADTMFVISVDRIVDPTPLLLY